LAPVVHGLEAKYYEEVNFVYLDIDDARTERFKEALNYRYQPHILLLDGKGQIVASWVGSVDESTLDQALNSIAN
jgi:thioredoxin-like negative regulator of GroEL